MPIYVIQAGEDGPCKIGVTENVWIRLQVMQTNNHAPLRLVALFDGGIVDEKNIHKTLSGHRITGEWFNSDPEILSSLISLPKLSISQPTKKPKGWQARRQWAIPKVLGALVDQLGGIDKISRRMGVKPWQLGLMVGRGRIPPEMYGAMCVKKPYSEYRRQYALIAEAHRFLRNDPEIISAMSTKRHQEKENNA